MSLGKEHLRSLWLWLLGDDADSVSIKEGVSVIGTIKHGYIDHPCCVRRGEQTPGQEFAHVAYLLEYIRG